MVDALAWNSGDRPAPEPLHCEPSRDELSRRAPQPDRQRDSEMGASARQIAARIARAEGEIVDHTEAVVDEPFQELRRIRHCDDLGQ